MMRTPHILTLLTLQLLRCHGVAAQAANTNQQVLQAKPDPSAGCPDSSYKRVPCPGGGYQCNNDIEIKCSGYFETDNNSNPPKKNWRCCPSGQFYAVSEGSNLGTCCRATHTAQVSNAKVACCPAGTKFTYSPQINSGDCCPQGYTFSVHLGTATGSCCPLGSCFSGSACSTNCGPNANPNDSTGSELGLGNLVNSERKVCQQNCNNLGLKYGRCYRLTSTSGQPVVRNIYNEYIFPTGTVRNQYEDNIFRVCDTNLDCNRTETPVTRKDEFVLNDFRGNPQDMPQGRRQYVGTNYYNKLSILDETFVYSSTPPQQFMSSGAGYGFTKFRGRPSAYGPSGCSICLGTFVENKKGFYLCDATNHATYSWNAFCASPNANYCLNLIFYEVPCMDSCLGEDGNRL